MKKTFFFFFISAIVSGGIFSATLHSENTELITNPQASSCHTSKEGLQGKQGPPGLQGPPGQDGPPGVDGLPAVGESTAFGSFYNTNLVTAFNAGDLLTFPTTSESVNITHPNDTDFVIEQSGYYMINFGVSSYRNGTGLETTIAILVNGVQAPNSLLGIRPRNNNGVLGTIALILLLEEGQTVTVQNVDALFNMGIGVPAFAPSVAAYFDIFLLAPQ